MLEEERAAANGPDTRPARWSLAVAGSAVIVGILGYGLVLIVEYRGIVECHQLSNPGCRREWQRVQNVVFLIGVLAAGMGAVAAVALRSNRPLWVSTGVAGVACGVVAVIALW